MNARPADRCVLSIKRKTSLLLAAMVVALGGAISQDLRAADGEQTLDEFVSTDSAIFYTFPGLPITAISEHGNVVRFDGPVGFEHIGVGAVGEGYVLCYNATNAYDVGSFESGFLDPTTVSCVANTCTIVRTTSDGKVQFTQEFQKSSTAELGRLMRIKMTVKNLTAGSLTNVILRRQADFDVDTGGPKGTSSFTNWFASGKVDSAFAWNSPNDYAQEAHALLLRHITKTPTAIKTASKVTEDILDTSCNPGNIADSGPVRGDYGVTLQYNIGTLKAKKSAVGMVEYQRN